MDNNVNQVGSNIENQNINSNINANQDNNADNEQRKSNTFNLIIGIATLLIALLGATFAYFSATARSAENDVTVKSAYVSISYDGGTEIKASNLIPSTLNVALNKYQKHADTFTPNEENQIDTNYDDYTSNTDRRCVDAKGREVCYVYQFSVISDGAEGNTTDILASIKVNQNEFDNLSYVLYEVDFETNDDETPLVDKYGFGIVKPNGYKLVSNFSLIDSNTDFVGSVYEAQNVRFAKFEKPEERYDENNLKDTINPVNCLFGYVENYEEKPKDDTSRCAKYTLTNKVKHTYQLVIWLEETRNVQLEQGLTFQGTVAIEVAGGITNNDYEDGKITGKQ